MRILKYPLHNPEFNQFFLPVGTVLLSVQFQHGVPTLWAQVEEGCQEELRSIRLYLTGEVLDTPNPGRYIGTAQNAAGDYVLHAYEVLG